MCGGRRRPQGQQAVLAGTNAYGRCEISRSAASATAQTPLVPCAVSAAGQGTAGITTTHTSLLRHSHSEAVLLRLIRQGIIFTSSLSLHTT